MRFERSCGVLLHPTSLPGPSGIGDLGPAAYHFVDFLVEAGQSWWQVLPLSPTGHGDSPYAALSGFACNPLLLDLEALVAEGHLERSELTGLVALPAARVDYGWVISVKLPLLRQAAERFRGDSGARTGAFQTFCAANASWLEDYALYAALKAAHGGAPWSEWEPEARQRQANALARQRRQLAGEIFAQKYMQFQFQRQWARLREYARQRGVRLIGDLPLFVNYDSADVWSRPELFRLDESGRPTVVAGVPPDYFNQDGQLWGNPHYRWDSMAEDGFSWWLDRLRTALGVADVVRIDHFRGFEAYWEIPAGEKTAKNGKWVKGPGEKFFQSVLAALGEIPLAAEDLGIITPAVRRLRDQFDLPGMHVLQFAFQPPKTPADRSKERPYKYQRNAIVYTGTHDNDTAIGWYHHSAGEAERQRVRRYLATNGSDINWALIRLAYSTPCDLAVVPLQDILGLGSEARMNFPGKVGQWWAWRFLPEQLAPWMAGVLREYAATFDRLPLSVPAAADQALEDSP